MRALARNKRTFYYALYEGKVPIVDNNGLDTGDFEIAYSDPVAFRANISPARGTADVEQFGITTNYTHTIVTDDKNIPIDTHSILWIGVDPSSGFYAVPHNFVVVQVARSLNSVTIAVREVDVSA